MKPGAEKEHCDCEKQLNGSESLYDFRGGGPCFVEMIFETLPSPRQGFMYHACVHHALIVGFDSFLQINRVIVRIFHPFFKKMAYKQKSKDEI